MLIRKKTDILVRGRKDVIKSKVNLWPSIWKRCAPKDQIQHIKHYNYHQTSRMQNCRARKGARSQVYYPLAPLTLFRAAAIKEGQLPQQLSGQDSTLTAVPLGSTPIPGTNMPQAAQCSQKTRGVRGRGWKSDTTLTEHLLYLSSWSKDWTDIIFNPLKKDNSKTQV